MLYPNYPNYWGSKYAKLRFPSPQSDAPWAWDPQPAGLERPKDLEIVLANE